MLKIYKLYIISVKDFIDLKTLRQRLKTIKRNKSHTVRKKGGVDGF